MFLRVVFQSLARRKGRKLAALVAIWTGVTLLGGLLTISIVVGDRLNRELQSFGANIRVLPQSDAIPIRVNGDEILGPQEHDFLSESDVLKLKNRIFWRNNIVGIVPRLSLAAQVQGRRVSLVGLWIAHAMTLDDGTRFVTGARAVYKNWRVKGTWPDHSGECLLGADLARRLGLAAGGSVSVQVGGRSEALRATGILSSDGPEDGSIVVPLAFVQRLADLRGKIGRVDVSALTTPEDRLARKVHEDPASLTPEEYERWSCVAYPGCVALSIQGAFPGAVASVVRRVAQTQGMLLKRIQGLMTTLALLTGLASLLSVLGVLASAIQERTGEAALLQAIGAGRRQVLALFLAESALLGLLGGGLAAATGPWLGEWLIRRVFSATGAFPLVVAVAAPALGVLLAVAAAFWPVWRTTARPPATLLHES